MNTNYVLVEQENIAPRGVPNGPQPGVARPFTLPVTPFVTNAAAGAAVNHEPGVVGPIRSVSRCRVSYSPNSPSVARVYVFFFTKELIINTKIKTYYKNAKIN